MVFVALAGSILFFDQSLKRWCDRELRIFERRPIVAGENRLVLSRVLNRGLAGDKFSGIPRGFIEPYTRYVPTLVWMALLAVALWRFRKAGVIERFGLCAILAGGASNLLDHWRSEYVTDTLQLCVTQTCVPFNVADVFILLGGVIVTVSFVRQWLKPVRLFS